MSHSWQTFLKHYFLSWWDNLWCFFKHCVVIARIDKIYDPSTNTVTNNTLARDSNWQFLQRWRKDIIGRALLVRGGRPQTNWVKGYCGFLISLKPLLTIGCYKKKVVGDKLFLAFEDLFHTKTIRSLHSFKYDYYSSVKITKEAGNHH